MPGHVGWRTFPTPGCYALIAATLTRNPRAAATCLRVAEELDPAWAARPLRLELHQGRLTLLSKDPGGEPLLGRLGQPWEIASFLRLAIGAGRRLLRFTSAASSIRISSRRMFW